MSITITYDIQEGTDSFSVDKTLTVVNSNVATAGQIWQEDISSMAISSIFSDCCPDDSMQYKVTATDGETTQSFGYQSSPAGLMSGFASLPHKILYYAPTGDPPTTKTTILTFEVKDCEDNVETLTVTLTNAYIQTS